MRVTGAKPVRVFRNRSVPVVGHAVDRHRSQFRSYAKSFSAVELETPAQHRLLGREAGEEPEYMGDIPHW